MRYFQFSEFIKSDIADRLDIDNKVSDARYVANIYSLVDGAEAIE